MTSHRKLIRPSLKESKGSNLTAEPDRASKNFSQSTPSPSSGSPPVSRRKQIPAEQTNAESFYYLKQMQTKTTMVIVLTDGEVIQGYIEWYDRHCLKINRHKESNLMIMKHTVKYMYKLDEEPKTPRRNKRANDKTSVDEDK